MTNIIFIASIFYISSAIPLLPTHIYINNIMTINNSNHTINSTHIVTSISNFYKMSDSDEIQKFYNLMIENRNIMIESLKNKIYSNNTVNKYNEFMNALLYSQIYDYPKNHNIIPHKITYEEILFFDIMGTYIEFVSMILNDIMNEKIKIK